MNPQISLIVPVYNVKKYLQRFLKSTLDHAFRNIEVIAVDDASTDDSPAELAMHAANEPRLKVISLPQNSGTLAARLAGLEAARGDFIAFMDHDDRIDVPVLEEALETALKTQADIVQFGAEIVSETPSGDCRVFETWKPARRVLHGMEILHRMSVYENHFWIPWDKLYRKAILQQAAARIIPGRFILGEDMYLVYLASYYARKYVPLNRIGCRHYRDTGESSFHTISISNFRSNQCPAMLALERVRTFLTDENVFAAVEREFIRNEGFHLEYLILLWRKAIPPENRSEGLDILLEYHDTPAMLRAFQRSFGNIIAILDLLDRSPADRRDLPCGSRICRLPDGDLPVFSWDNTARLEALQHLIRNQSANVVVLPADLENPVLFHDAVAVRSMKAFAVVQWDKPFIGMLGGQLAKTLTTLRICRFADAVIVPDDSLAWFQQLGFRTIRLPDEKTIDEIIPKTETVRSAESFRKLFAVLDPSRQEVQPICYRTIPGR